MANFCLLLCFVFAILVTWNLFFVISPVGNKRVRLGDYDGNQFSDKRVQAPLAKLQQAIEDIETDMVDE